MRPNWQVTLPYDVQNPLESIGVVRQQESSEPYESVGQQTPYYRMPRYLTSPTMQEFAESFGNAREAIQQTDNIYSYQPDSDDDYGADEMGSTFLQNDQRLDLRKSEDFRNDDYDYQSYQDQLPSFTNQ